MFYKNSILILSLIMLAGCSTSNKYQVTYDSDPQGATLICGGEDQGYTPVILYYDESVRLEPYINVSNCSANWRSGVKQTYSTKLNVFPDSVGTISTLERPKGIGYAEDVIFARTVKQMQAEPTRGYSPVNMDEFNTPQKFTTCYRMDNKISLGQSLCVTQ
jgi:hypothetical protein